MAVVVHVTARRVALVCLGEINPEVGGLAGRFEGEVRFASTAGGDRMVGLDGDGIGHRLTFFLQRRTDTEVQLAVQAAHLDARHLVVHIVGGDDCAFGLDRKEAAVGHHAAPIVEDQATACHGAGVAIGRQAVAHQLQGEGQAGGTIASPFIAFIHTGLSNQPGGTARRADLAFLAHAAPFVGDAHRLPWQAPSRH